MATSGPNPCSARGLLAVLVFLVAGRPAQAASPGPDPSKALTQLGLDTWTTDQGLPNATVNAVVHSREGYVWLATYDGLVRFDGTRFTVFSKANGLGANGIRALCEDGDGNLWIGTNGAGVVRYAKGVFRRFGANEGLPSELVWALHTDIRDGSVWVGTNGGGVAHVAGGRVERFPVEIAGRTISAITQTDDGTLWIAANADGLKRRTPDGRFTTFSTAQGVPPGLVLSLGPGRDGALWAGTSKGGVFRVEGGRVLPPPAALEPLRVSAVSALLEDEAGTLWIGTNGEGLGRFAGGALTYRGMRGGIADIVYSLQLDRGGNLWIGTNGGGVSRLRDGSFVTYTARDGLSKDFSYAVFEDRSGTLWAGSVGGLDRLVGSRFVPVPLPTGKVEVVRSIAEARDGSLWFGTYGTGVWRLEKGRWKAFGIREGLASHSVRAILPDRQGRVWAATLAGLCLLEGERWRTFGTAEGLPLSSLIGMAEDREGNLWVGTDGGGLVRFRDGRFQVFTTKDGLASNLILSLYADGGGELWVGTNGGLSRLRGERFVSFGRREGLPSDGVTQIAGEAGGHLWIGTGRGVVRIDRSSLDREPAPGSLVVETFDRSDGMESSQCSAPGQPGGIRARDGRLWFTTARGLAVLDPARLQLDTEPPTMVVEEVLVNGEPVPFQGGIDIPPGPARIEVGFAALSPRGPGRTAARFRLEGFDAGWVNAGESRKAHYTGVPPGRYRFQLAGRAGNGPWGEAGGPVPLRVRPRFHQTVTFAVLVVFGVAGAAFAGHRLRVRRLEARERELKEVVAERTHSLAEGEQRFRQMAENIDAAFFVRSLDPPELLYMSPAYERIWGRPATSDPAEFYATLHPDDLPGFVAAFSRQAEGYDVEYRILRPDGAVRWIRSRTFPVVGEEGRVDRIAGLAEDVSLRKSAETMRDDLTHMLVHDLRGPLASIHASMDALEKTLPPASGLALGLVRVARNGTLKLLSLINTILDVSRFEQGAMPLRREAVDVAEVTSEVLALIRPLAEARRVLLAQELSDVPRVLADRALLGRILENLVGNAIKLSAAGGAVRVSAAADPGDGAVVRIRVEDEGPGIPEELRGRLFEKFVAGRERSGGTGLGLLFCRLAVEAHGGRIQGDNRPGGGAVFTFTLPAERAAP